ncbi:unnamed protein product [Meganyctiphanes norvegica]|uniref:Uncharacterized protein n=1 Tax=Meganyctiphanes norvegica TaxID=48144 RepID=A0AAV2SCJ4_MEGNR
MASMEVLLPSPRMNMCDTGGVLSVLGCEVGGGSCGGTLQIHGGPRHRKGGAVRRPSGTNSEESDSPPSKKMKKSRRRRRRQIHHKKRLSDPFKPVAPFNTTQFLMAEHDKLKDQDIVKPERNRDSSCSIDSDEVAADFYESPEGEDDFIRREFWAVYEDVHAERLDTMTKGQLVQEYLLLEERVDMLERQLRAVRHRQRCYTMMCDDDDDYELRPGEARVDPETAQKITIFQSEIAKLEKENKRLLGENIELRRTSISRASSSSDSSSDSGSSSDSSSESSSDSDDDNVPSVIQEVPVSVLSGGGGGVETGTSGEGRRGRAAKVSAATEDENHGDSGVYLDSGSGSLDSTTDRKRRRPDGDEDVSTEDHDTKQLKDEDTQVVSSTTVVV